MAHSFSRQTRSISDPKVAPPVLRAKYSTLELPVGFSCDGHSSHLKHSRGSLDFRVKSAGTFSR